MKRHTQPSDVAQPEGGAPSGATVDPPRLRRLFVTGVAVFLVLTGGIKLASVLQETRVLGAADPLLPWLTVRQVLFLAAVLELGVAAALFRRREAGWAPGLILWLVAVFGAYRLGLWAMGSQGHCGCLGYVFDWQPGLNVWSARLMLSSLAGMAAGSVWLLLRRRATFQSHSYPSRVNYSRILVKHGGGLCLMAISSAVTPCPVKAAITTDSEAVTAFKRHLATPPCYSKILFADADCSNNVTRSYYAAVCGDNYVYRTLDGNEHIDLPVSITNRNRSSIYVGRWGDMRWAIAGYDLTIQTQSSLMPGSPDGSSYVFVNELLTFGFQHVQAGTFVWNGNHFVAKPSLFARELGVTENFVGEIVVEDDRVKRMIIQTAGVSEFGYDDPATNIPKGLPSTISRLTLDGHCYKRILIRNMTEASSHGELASLFNPHKRLQPEIAVIRVLSNGVENVTSAQDPQMRKEMLAEQLADFTHLTRRELAKRSFVQRTFLVIIVLLVGFGVWRVWKQRSAVR